MSRERVVYDEFKQLEREVKLLYAGIKKTDDKARKADEIAKRGR